MIYKIRHINDETLIKWESVCLISTWTIFSFLQYILFLISQRDSCTLENTSAGMNLFATAYTAAYWLILVRDFITMLITIYFCMTVIRQ
jgi:hypothetical protein